MKKILIANWKMYLSLVEANRLAMQYKSKLVNQQDFEIIVAPDFLFLAKAKEIFAGQIKLASQDIAPAEKGTLTGEVSAKSLKISGCSYSLVGHSERRNKLGETDELINQKIEQIYNGAMIPILCIGETKEQKDEGQRDRVLSLQLQNALKKIDLKNKQLIIAYEPVWAIGTGDVMEVSEMGIILRTIKKTISSLFSERIFDEQVKVLYGGSIDGKSSKNYLKLKNLDGLLVGSASLDVNEVKKIIGE